jgi:electron transport complex protein RnfE
MKHFVLGLAPVLAVSTLTINGIGMGLIFALTLLLSSGLIFLIRDHLPEIIRNSISVIIIAAVVTLIQLATVHYAPDLCASLGIYLPIIAVNCYIYYSAGVYPGAEAPLKTFKACLYIVIISVFAGLFREIAGKGTITMMIAGAGFTYDLGKSILKDISLSPAVVFAMPAGGFLIAGLVLAFIQHIKNISRRNKTWIC